MQLDNSFVQGFTKEVHLAFEEEGATLRNTVQSELGVRGSEYKFPFLGGIQMGDATAAGVDVEASDVSNGMVTCQLKDKSVAVYTGEFDLEKTPSEGYNRDLAVRIGQAIGRMEDTLITDAMKAGVKSSNKVAIGYHKDGSTIDVGLTMDKLRRAKRLLDNAGVPSKNRHAVISPAQAENLLESVEFNSRDFNSIQSLIDGDVDGQRFLGFTFHQIADMTADGKKTGLPLSAGKRSCFFYHEDAAGIAVTNIDKRSSITYIAHKESFLVSGKHQMGACVIDTAGVVEVVCKED